MLINFFLSALHQVSNNLQEYLRFKQKKGWRRLAVYKSGIHALGLYTMEFIAEGEVVRTGSSNKLVVAVKDESIEVYVLSDWFDQIYKLLHSYFT